MVEKLKKGMKIGGTCLWLLAGVFLCGKIEVYGAEGRLTEEEVKRQVVEIVEEDREGEVTRSTVVEYDIEDLYQIIYIDLFINDYIGGVTFREIIEEKRKKSLEQKENYAYWILPYKNIKGKKCTMVFLEIDKRVEISSRTWKSEEGVDMSVFHNKYEEISTETIEEEIYIELDLFGFGITYIRLNDKDEYIIPFFRDEESVVSNIEHGKIYNIDMFITEMYNCFDEPTKSELKKIGEKVIWGDLNVLIRRKQRLNYSDIEEIRLVENIKENGVCFIIGLAFVILLGVNIYKIRNKKDSKKHNF